jgi:hypothetical protein
VYTVPTSSQSWVGNTDITDITDWQANVNNFSHPKNVDRATMHLTQLCSVAEVRALARLDTLYAALNFILRAKTTRHMRQCFRPFTLI